ncbi:DUF3800 domain-containing protein [Pantoea coffeiphila]|uniref:DUF3800 domain-containing protein n=1 Tax=Pantoea coffeiphila TaxID=1465635 RepID=UPI0019603580|nr:DUF3800 domain-containing protein [Pantoea coffeiphila]MBM7342706.1 hypothetical protein [Pantoea coffeiphila]
MAKYQIFADEAWTHGTPPPNRYHCFFGGIFGLESDVDRLQTELTKIKMRNGITQEVKWSNVSPENVTYYHELIDCIKNHILNNNIKYRQMFRDRVYHPVPLPEQAPQSELDIQFLVYYQYLKHSFGCEYLPIDPDGTTILIRLDGHSSERHKTSLTNYLEALPAQWKRADITVNVTYENSKNSIRLQVCDLLMGAAGYYGNKFHLRRQNNRRGMTKKQKIKHEMSSYIYNSFREIDKISRGSKAFNWFESTGTSGDKRNRLDHCLRIWKFIPENHVVNKGWQNDNLDRYGMFIADNFE